MKGPPPGPVARFRDRLKRHCRVIDIDEFNTSKVCNCCKVLEAASNKGSLRNMVSEKMVRRTRAITTQKIHGVLHCSTSACAGMTVDRDVNASRNILELTLAAMRQEDRPSCFCRRE